MRARGRLLRAVITASVLGAALPSAAQDQPRVKLDLAVDDARLIVQTLGAVACGSVQQLIVCRQAADLLADIRKQVIAQGK